MTTTDVSQPEKTTEWNEGRAAFAAGIEFHDCPYSLYTQWDQWVDWTCGHGEADHEAWLKGRGKGETAPASNNKEGRDESAAR